MPKLIQNPESRVPSLLPTITANMISTAVSVNIVPPTVMATALFFAIPNALTMG